MTNVARIAAREIVSFLSKTEGAAGRIHLTRKQLELIARAQAADGNKAASKMLSKHPEISSLDLAYKAKSNYSIGAFKLMEGKTPCATGAISVTTHSDISTKPVVKFRHKGTAAQSNGFVDLGKLDDATDLTVSLSRRGGNVEGNISSNISSGKAFAAHVKVNESAAVDGFKTWKEILEENPFMNLL